MYIPVILLIIVVVYIFYLLSKKEELSELQRTIALLQEQILLLEAVKKRINKLENEGVAVIVPGDEDDQDDEDANEKYTEILSRAYFKGWEQLSEGVRNEVHINRGKAEKTKF